MIRGVSGSKRPAGKSARTKAAGTGCNRGCDSRAAWPYTGGTKRRRQDKLHGSQLVVDSEVAERLINADGCRFADTLLSCRVVIERD